MLNGNTKRSIAKTITWRLIAITITYTIVYIITKDLIRSTLITIFADSIKTVAYFLHERGWKKIKWGKEH